MPDVASRTHPTSTRSMATPLAVLVAVVSSAVVSVALSTAVAAIAHGAGASHKFKALTFPVYTFFIVFGLLVAAIAWSAIRSRSADPAGLLRWLAPVVVLVSFVPDVVVGAAGSLPGSSWGAVLALMIMHVVVAVCGVAAYRIFLPLPARART